MATGMVFLNTRTSITVLGAALSLCLIDGANDAYAASQLHSTSTKSASSTLESRIIPLQSQAPFWDGLSIGMFVFANNLRSETGRKYDSLAGAGMSMEQVLRSIFVGRLSARGASWNTKPPASESQLFPLSITTHVEIQPQLDHFFGEEIGNSFRPFVYGGPGYVIFSSLENLEKPKSVSIASGGIGIKFVSDDRMAFRFALEATKSMGSTKHSTGAIIFEVQFGDLARP